MNQLPQVLLVDDNPADVGLAREALAGGRHQTCISTVADGEEAMAFLHRAGRYANAARPDLVILDLHLEGMGGFGFLAWRMKSPRIAMMPLLVLSAPRDEGATRRALRLKADGYFPRPQCFEEWMALARMVWAVGMIHSR